MLSELWSHQTTVQGTHKSTMFPGKSPHLQDLAVSDDCMDCPDGSRRITESGWRGTEAPDRNVQVAVLRSSGHAFLGISPLKLWFGRKEPRFPLFSRRATLGFVWRKYRDSLWDLNRAGTSTATKNGIRTGPVQRLILGLGLGLRLQIFVK